MSLGSPLSDPGNTLQLPPPPFWGRLLCWAWSCNINIIADPAVWGYWGVDAAYPGSFETSAGIFKDFSLLSLITTGCVGETYRIAVTLSNIR